MYGHSGSGCTACRALLRDWLRDVKWLWAVYHAVTPAQLASTMPDVKVRLRRAMVAVYDTLTLNAARGVPMPCQSDEDRSWHMPFSHGIQHQD